MDALIFGIKIFNMPGAIIRVLLRTITILEAGFLQQQLLQHHQRARIS